VYGYWRISKHLTFVLALDWINAKTLKNRTNPQLTIHVLSLQSNIFTNK
jgi:hypothetical protein